MTPVDTVVLIPVLGRAHRVVPVVQSIRATSRAHILFLCTPGDQDVIDQIINVDAPMMFVTWQDRGDFQRKINTGYAVTTEPLIFTGADDLLFHPGWLTAAKAKLAPGIGVVGTNDLGNPRVMAGEHSTHSLITRDYIDQYGTIDGPGEVMHTGYVHDFCDNELVETAKMRGAWAMALDSHVEHLHVNWNKAPMDDSYAKQGQRMLDGRRVYQQRRHLWT